MVEFLSLTNIFKENKNIDGKTIYSDDLVADGIYFSPAIANSMWYVPPRERNIKTIISLRSVIKSDI